MTPRSHSLCRHGDIGALFASLLPHRKEHPRTAVLYAMLLCGHEHPVLNLNGHEGLRTVCPTAGRGASSQQHCWPLAARAASCQFPGVVGINEMSVPLPLSPCACDDVNALLPLPATPEPCRPADCGGVARARTHARRQRSRRMMRSR